MNHRRKIIFALGAGALTAPFGGLGQHQGKVWRVGVLTPRSRPASIDADILGSFVQGLRDLGYVEGKNLVIEWRFADGDIARFPDFVADCRG